MLSRLPSSLDYIFDVALSISRNEILIFQVSSIAINQSPSFFASRVNRRVSRCHWAVMATLDSSNRSLLSDDGSSELENGFASADQQRIKIQANTILVKVVTGFLFMMLVVAILDLDMESYAFDEQRPAFTSPVVISNPQTTPWQNPIEEGLYTNHTLDSVLNEIGRLRSFIWDTWNVSNFPNFLKTMHVPTRSYDLQVLKFQKLLLQSHDKSFVMGITGSSVTAGHDNFFNES